MQQAAQATRDVTVSIDGVGRASADTGAATTGVLGTASDLSKQAEQLAGEVKAFVADVRAA